MAILKKIIKRIIKIISPSEIYIERIVDGPYLDKDGVAGKNALIIGGNGEIGRAVAKRLLQAKANVIIAGRNKEELIKIQKNFECLGNIDSFFCDVASVKSIEELIQQGFRNKNREIDILVNCSGYLSSVEYDTGCNCLFEMNENEWDKVIDINLKGTYFMCQKVAQYMLEQKISGNIINIVSTTMNRASVAPYAFAKNGVANFTKGLAKELMPYGIRVNGVAPGPVGTKMLHFEEKGANYYREEIPDRRIASTEDIANAVYYLISDYSKHIVGHILVCDGGESIF